MLWVFISKPSYEYVKFHEELYKKTIMPYTILARDRNDKQQAIDLQEQRTYAAMGADNSSHDGSSIEDRETKDAHILPVIERASSHIQLHLGAQLNRPISEDSDDEAMQIPLTIDTQNLNIDSMILSASYTANHTTRIK